MVFQPVMTGMNRWKAFALIMIALLAISIGIRFYYIEVHTFPIDENQKLFAINAAKNGFKEEIGSAEYNVTVQNRGSIINTEMGEKKVVRIIIEQENMTLSALVDLETGNVVEKNKIESSGWMTEYKNQNPKRWIHQRLFGG